MNIKYTECICRVQELQECKKTCEKNCEKKTQKNCEKTKGRCNQAIVKFACKERCDLCTVRYEIKRLLTSFA